MKIGRESLLLFAILFAPHSAFAEYTGMGAGTRSCGSWTEARKDRTIKKTQNEEWVLGFLSGAGYVGGTKYDPLNGLDAPAVLAWVDNYCLANPLKTIADVASSFIDAHPK